MKKLDANKSLEELIKANTEIHGSIDNPNSGYIYEIQERIRKTPISDITDNEDNQYVDLVMEGGTMWGLALIGYTYTLEKAGIRFLNLAGTSAGSINAMILAALGNSSKRKSERLLNIFSKMDFKSFIDGGCIVSCIFTIVSLFTSRKLINFSNRSKISRLIKFMLFLIFLNLVLLALSLTKGFGVFRLGFNPGKNFEEWLSRTLVKLDTSNTSKLLNKLVNDPTLMIRKNAIRKYLDTDGKEKNFHDDEKQYFEDNFKTNEIAVITSDITTQSKITFPQMANLYWKNPLNINPSKFVRASMSIPIIFEPVIRKDLPKDLAQNWLILTGYNGTPINQAYLVDGGVLSNFPIDVFHCHDRVPLCPTFGVKLGMDRQGPYQIINLFKFIGAIGDTAINNSDFSFIFNNDDYKKLIAYIDTSKEFIQKDGEKVKSSHFSSLDFNMPNDKKAALFALGAEAAKDFICGNKIWNDWNELNKQKSPDKKEPMPPKAIPPFDWEEYKLIRKDLVVPDPPAYRAKKDRIKQASLQQQTSNRAKKDN